MPSILQRVSVLVPLVVVVGCALFPPSKATVDVADVASAFPAIERLAAVVYSRHEENEGEDCIYFQYGRGAFTSLPEDEFCRVFDFDNRHPGGGDEGPVPVAFDDEARDDLAALMDAFKDVGAPLDYMNLVLAADGSVGPDSGFGFDRCVMYWYEPGWAALPEDIEGESLSTGIDKDWHKTDNCP